MDIEKTNTFASGFYQGVQIVNQYMADRAVLIDGVMVNPSTQHRDQALTGLWYRARGWMQSLERLNHTRHVQAISVANRALLEITVDMILLHHDKTNESGWRMYCWGQSERMKAAEQIVDYYTKKGVAVPDAYKALENSYNNEKAMIDHQRRILWPNKKNPAKAEHPSRWTGRSDLSRDIEEADRLHGPAIEDDLGVTLTEFYRTEYRKMNWQIHSGIAGFWNLPPETFNLIAALALKWCTDFAMLGTKITLIDFEFNTALQGLQGEWDKIKLQRGLAYVRTVHNLSEDDLK